ncbi:glycosyl hydrolase family 20, catalytic domain-containing protein [Phthorimaea operculella]|nr:glycosyl hydrolase family 20, catalytic domain-containing protein [Phthorimaea operculella]
MLREWTIFFLFLLLANGNSNRIGPRHPATQGEVWPKPYDQTKSTIALNVDPDNLKYEITGKNCTAIGLAIQRCKKYLNKLKSLKRVKRAYYEYDVHGEDTVKALRIHLTNDCEDFPHFNMVESYKLEVTTISTLNSSSVWGIIRGIETFSQLFYLTKGFKQIHINQTLIHDRPNYPHRGLLLDTGRHFLSVQSILRTLDAMAMNKMNVLHWHIVDDESFPFQSTKYPEFNKGIYDTSMIYRKKDMEAIRESAKNLGIRILVELDMPGHTWCWAVAHPEVITKCKDDGSYAPPLNPVKPETYALVKGLISEMQEVFPDSHFHLGGDEVRLEYYLQDPDIKKYMEKHNMTEAFQIHALFFHNVIPLLKEGTNAIVWEDVIDSNVTLPDNVLVQTWRNNDGSDAMVKVLKAGYKGIQSAPYYLDLLKQDAKWFYKNEPRLAVKSKLKDEALLKNLVGGTACMWGEMVDDTNVLSRVWPRASAVAEVLWSETDGAPPDEATLRRLEEHTCRMRRRGIPAEPAAGPGYCIVK